MDWFGGGGAIANLEGTLNISDSSFYENETNGMGGAIFNYHGTANISSSTFFENGVNYPEVFVEVGGAIANDEGTLNISNSTFGHNYCQPYYRQSCSGGGIVNSGTLILNNSTFKGNAAYTFGYPSTSEGGGIYNDAGQLRLSNTIIAKSIGGDCISGSPSVNINNLIEDGSCNPAYSGDPLLGPIQDNGGSTWTFALTAPSPALDAGDDGVCAAPPVNNLDQRGVTRPLDGDGDGTPICDIGAYEYDGPPPDRFYLPLFFRN